MMTALYSSSTCHAQQTSKKTSQKTDKHHVIYLEKPASCIDKLRYKDGAKIDGKLTKDGMRVLIKNYDELRDVHFLVNYTDGEIEEAYTGYCYISTIDPL